MRGTTRDSGGGEKKRPLEKEVSREKILFSINILLNKNCLIPAKGAKQMSEPRKYCVCSLFLLLSEIFFLPYSVLVYWYLVLLVLSFRLNEI